MCISSFLKTFFAEWLNNFKFEIVSLKNGFWKHMMGDTRELMISNNL